MTWTPVDLATIAGILDDLSVNPFGADANFPERLLDMLDAHTVPDPDTPSVDANRRAGARGRAAPWRDCHGPCGRAVGVPPGPAPGPDAWRLDEPC